MAVTQETFLQEQKASTPYPDFFPSFPEVSQPVTLAEYTSENLKYALYADPLSITVMMTLAWWKIKDASYVPTTSELHQVINLIQDEPFDNVIKKVKPNKPLPITTDTKNHWVVGETRVREIREELESKGIFSDGVDPFKVFAIGGNFLRFWSVHESPITPRNILATRPWVINRLRLFKVVSHEQSVAMKDLEKATMITKVSLRDSHILPLEELGLLKYTLWHEAAYQLVPEVNTDLAERVITSIERPSSRFGRNIYDQIVDLPIAYRSVPELLTVLKGNESDVRKVLFYFANNPIGALLNRKNPGVSFADAYKETLKEFVEIVDGSISPSKKFLTHGMRSGIHLINDPEFIHTFLLQARNELAGYELRQAVPEKRREVAQAVAQSVEGEQVYQLPAGISEPTFQFMQFVDRQAQQTGGFPRNSQEQPIISEAMYQALHQLILEGVSLNKIAFGLGTENPKNWNTKKRLIEEALVKLAKAFYVPSIQHAQILEFFTDEARTVRRVRYAKGETTILSTALLVARRAQEMEENAQGREEEARRRARQQEADEIVALLTPETVTQYMKTVKDLPSLSENEERALLKRAIQGDRPAREQLTLGYLKYIVEFAESLKQKGISLVDIIGEGNLALVELIYGTNELSIGSFRDELRRMYNERIHSLRQREYAKSITDEDEEGLLIQDLLVADRKVEPEVMTLQSELFSHVRALLNAKELAVVNLRLGLEGGEGLSTQEIAQELGLSVENVERFEQEAMLKLRSSGFFTY